MADTDDAQTPPPLTEIAKAIVARILDPGGQAKLMSLLLSTRIEGWKDAFELAFRAAPIATSALATALVKALNTPEPIYDELAKAAVDGLFGVGSARAGRSMELASTVATKVMDALAPPATSLEPGDVAAKQYLDVVTHLAFEGWLQGWLIEAASAVIPGIEKLETFAQLDDTLANVLGLSRLSRRVLSPMLDVTVVAPLRWQVNNIYRPELLSAAETARQILRGRWSREKGFEELARQGWSEDRIEALLNAQRRFFGVGDVRQFVEREHWTKDQGLHHLQDQGYEPDAAEDALRLEGLRRIEQLEAAEASLILQSYANYEISDADFRGLLRDFIGPPAERALLEELGTLRRRLNIKHLGSSDVARMVEAGILAFVDYRRALEREGFTPEAVTEKELFLRWQLDQQKAIAEHRAALEAERTAEKEQRDAARAMQRAAIEAERALARRGAESDLEDAAVRGLIPFARVEEVYAARYDADTVAILVDILEERRAAYLDEQRRREDAVKRAQGRNLTVGDLEAAVLADVLTLDQYRAGLEARQFDAVDIDILSRTLAVRKRELDDATRKRAEAEAAARRKGIDLGRVERLVRLGLRTMPQYTALLAAMGFDEAAIAAMRELLAREIADDRKADAERQAAERQVRAKGLSVDEFRRAVILALQTRAQYQAFLAAQGFTADRITLLMRELDEAVQDAEAARARRQATPVTLDARVLPLATVARAARLGVVTVDTYLERLRAAGYGEDDVGIELELLLLEIGDVQAARQARAAAPAADAPKGLSLAELAHAVKAGLKSLDDYRARAVELGFSRDAVDTQVRVLGDELRLTEIAKARRAALDVDAKDRGLALAELEAGVIAGTLTLAGFVAQLERAGLALADAELLASILLEQLEASGASRGR